MPSLLDLTLHFFLQMAVILGTYRLLWPVFKKLGQVQVVHEVPHPVLPGGEVLEERETGRLRQGVEERGLGLVHVEERGRGFHRHRHAAIISLGGDEREGGVKRVRWRSVHHWRHARRLRRGERASGQGASDVRARRRRGASGDAGRGW